MLSRKPVIALLLTVAFTVVAGGKGPAARPVDCFGDDVTLFVGGFTPPEEGLRVGELPGIVLGPPGDSFPVNGSVSTVSLGRNGWIVVEFTDNLIVDGPGSDFIVFENAFFKSVMPTDPNQSFDIFVEPASVAVSENGIDFIPFPYDPNALALVGQDATSSTALPLLRGLAGVTPTFSGDYTIPDDPDAWDPNGSGGISGGGGDAFDLAEVGLSTARYVLLSDLGLATGFAGTAEGFDLDSIVAINSVPVFIGVDDSDGDGLSDNDEVRYYGSDPHDDDTDGDGEQDGLEAAGCSDPASLIVGPFFVIDADLRVVDGAAGTHVTWSFLSSTSTHDVVRGLLTSTGTLPDGLVCIEDGSFNLTTSDSPDTADPSPGETFFYLVRPSGATTYGLGSDGTPRSFMTGDCPL
jgi:hypothetical protein